MHHAPFYKLRPGSYNLIPSGQYRAYRKLQGQRKAWLWTATTFPTEVGAFRNRVSLGIEFSAAPSTSCNISSMFCRTWLQRMIYGDTVSQPCTWKRRERGRWPCTVQPIISRFDVHHSPTLVTKTSETWMSNLYPQHLHELGISQMVIPQYQRF